MLSFRWIAQRNLFNDLLLRKGRTTLGGVESKVTLINHTLWTIIDNCVGVEWLLFSYEHADWYDALGHATTAIIQQLSNYCHKKINYNVCYFFIPLWPNLLEDHPEGNVSPSTCFDFSNEATETTNSCHRCLSGLANPCRPDTPVFFFFVVVSEAFRRSMDQCK